MYLDDFSEQDEAELVQKHFEEVYEIFQQSAFLDGEPIMCQIHNVFGTFDTPHHNCLGCNFADSTELIVNFLQTYAYQTRIQFAYTTFILLAYLTVERIDTLFRIIKLDDEYKQEHFKALGEIRVWANFLKHPKAFILTHHPTFSFIGSPDLKSLTENANVRIDRNFIEQYYKEEDENKNKQLYKKLENKDKVLVIFPNALELAQNLCEAMQNCVSLIRDNKIYRDKLKDRATFLNYHWAGFSDTNHL
jgi:hypothetical protein